MRWTAYNGVLSICDAPDTCNNCDGDEDGDCGGPSLAHYSITGNRLVLVGYYDSGVSYTLYRVGYSPSDNSGSGNDTGGATPPPASTPRPQYPYQNNPHHTQFIYTRSSIQLPNERLSSDSRAAWIAEYYYNGGASAFELQMIYLINQTREYYGLHPLAISAPMMHAARFYTQTLANLDLDLGSNFGPYGGSRATATAFGARLRVRQNDAGNWLLWSGGSGNWGGWSYTAILTTWLNNPNHRHFILSPDNNYIGFGSHLGGVHGVFHYLLLSNNY